MATKTMNKIDNGKADDTVNDVILDDNKNDEDVDNDPPSFENILEYLGVPGRFQLIQILVVKASLIICSYIVLSIIFVGFVPEHRCRRVNETQLLSQYAKDLTGNGTTSSTKISYEACNIKIITTLNETNTLEGDPKQPTTAQSTLPCPNGRDFFNAKDTTYISEWDLVCESKGLAEFTQTTFTIGQIIGGLIASPVTDYFGRKPVIVASMCLCPVVEIAHILSPNIYVVYLVKIVSGLVFQAAITSGYIFIIELVVPRHRQTLAVIMNMTWVNDVITVGGVAYFLQDKNWRYLHGVSIGTGIFSLLTPFVLKESPRWLAVNGKKEEALQILKRYCQCNKKDFEIVKQKLDDFIAYKNSAPTQSVTPLLTNDNKDKLTLTSDKNNISTCNTQSREGRTLSPFALLRNRRLLFLVIVGWYLWFTNILIYYGLFMTSSVLAGDRFLNYVLMAIVEYPSLGLSLFLMKKFGRRPIFRTFIGLAGVCLMTSALVSTLGRDLPGSGTAITALSILGKFSISASFGVLYVMTPEIFPTNVRTTGHGYCSALGRLGSMIAPFMGLFHAEVEWGPALLFTVMSGVAVILTFTLPETKDIDLPNTIEDVMKRPGTNYENELERNKGNRVV